MAVETFSTEAAGRIAGPEWLRTRRLSSATAALEAPLPTPEAEEWRYSRIAELDLSRYHLLDPGDDAPGVPPIVESLVSALGELSGLVVLHNGRSAGIDVLGAAAEAGVTVGSPDAADLLGLTDEPVDLFAAYNDAFAADPIVIDIPRNTDLDLPLAVVSFIDAEGAAVFPRVVVRAGENSSVQVIEVSFSTDVPAFVAPVTEIAVGPAARVRYAAMQDLGPRVWQLGSFSAEVGQDATLDAAVAALGGDYGRLRLDCRLVGRGATGNLSSVYFGDGRQMLDLRTFQEHRAPDTTSNLLFKGAVADDSHAVYTGLIRIKPEARGTQRLPDQPQPQAVTGCLGGVGSEPRDREQRCPLLACVDGRPGRRGPALLPREPRRPHPGGGATHRRRLLRRGGRRLRRSGARTARAGPDRRAARTQGRFPARRRR